MCHRSRQFFSHYCTITFSFYDSHYLPHLYYSIHIKKYFGYYARYLTRHFRVYFISSHFHNSFFGFYTVANFF